MEHNETRPRLGERGKLGALASLATHLNQEGSLYTHPRAVPPSHDGNPTLEDTEPNQLGDDHRVWKSVTDTALKLLPADHASLRLCQRDGSLAVVARSGVASKQPAPRFARGRGVLGWVAENGLVARVGDIKDDPRFEPIEHDFVVHSVLSVPLRVHDRTLGVLSMSAPRTHAFEAEDERIAMLLATMAAQAFRICELETLAVTDAHTRAFNRRYLFPRMREEMSRCKRYGDSLSVLLMDLDHFKQVNDVHGHAAGDEVLQSFVRTVQQCVRSVDALIRRGGEEFVLVMPSTSWKEAFQAAERIRRTFAAKVIPLPESLDASGGLTVTQTVSIGVAHWDANETAEQLDQRADEAMYEAKRRGRNNVVLHREIIPQDTASTPPLTEGTRLRRDSGWATPPESPSTQVA